MFKILSLIKFAATAGKVVADLLNKTKSAGPVEIAIAATNDKKTYLAAAGLIAYGVLGVLIGQTSVDVAVTLVLNGLGLASIRHAIQKFVDRFVTPDPQAPDDPEPPAPAPVTIPIDPPTPTPSKKLAVDDLLVRQSPPAGNRFFPVYTGLALAG